MFTFELATEHDDPALRDLLAHTPMPGQVTVAFCREPNYFLGCPTMGRFWQVIIARHQPGGDIALVLCRAVRSYWVNGQQVDLGYIGQIRIAERYRSQWLLWRGLDFFRTLHADNRVSTYFGVISDENTIARGVLIDKPSRRFPHAREVTRIHTLGIIVRKPMPSLFANCALERGTLERLPQIAAFLQQEGARKQFFPVYSEDDLIGETTRGFQIEDFVVARRGEQIVGVVGLWDQSGYKQSLTQGYSGALRWLRPLYNVGLRVIGARPLPNIGEPIHSAYASFICIADNQPDVFRALLRQVYNLAAERGYAYLMVGLTEGDPLLSAAAQYMHIDYYSRLYLGSWDTLPTLDERIPYIEIAML